MLKVIDKGNGIVHVTEPAWKLDYRDAIPYCNYVPVLERMSYTRVMEFGLLEGKTAEDFQRILEDYPHARIVHYIDHEPYITEREQQLILGHVRSLQDIAAWKRVKEDGVEVIDEFGFHVYIKQDIDFQGILPDVDFRYQMNHV